jgi:class 3 adenylate cyclase
MFIDRHDAPGLSPEELAAAHQLDLAVQEQYRVQYHTYWFDPETGAVFCLAEGPSQQAVEEVHRVAHGQPASLIIEIDQNAPLNAFFGTLPNHPPGTSYTAPAVRAIVFTDMCGSVAQTHELGDDGHLELLREHNAIVRGELVAHDGREVKHTGDGIMAAFSSISAAVAFAIGVQRAIERRNLQGTTPLEVSIGISAGEPVTDNDNDLFGAAVQLAARLCGAASSGDIHVSVAVRELCIGKPIRFEDRGSVVLKGLPEPAQIYAVAWREQGS